MSKPSFTCILILASALIGCRKDGPGAASPDASHPIVPVAAAAKTAPADASLPPVAARGQPQGKLPTVKLWAGTNSISAEVASTLNQIRTGMMWRTNMAEMEGMLFAFPAPQQANFYMRNTLLPLTCAYLDAEGMILEIYDMKPLDETTISSRSDQVQYVLEMNLGWFQRHDIKPGVVLSTDLGTFPQTFRRR